MKLSALFLSLPFVVFTAACGGTKEPAAAPSQTTSSDSKETGEHAGHHGHEEGADHEKHHADLPPALKDFHGVLAPVWHSGTGTVRVEKACTDVKSMQEKAKATSDAELVSATDALAAACAKDGKPEVEAKLGIVHERFHKLAEPKGEKH